MKWTVLLCCPFTPHPLPTISEAQHCLELQDTWLQHVYTLFSLCIDIHSALTAVYRFTGKFLYHWQPEEIVVSWTFKIIFIYFYFSQMTWCLATFLPSPFCSSADWIGLERILRGWKTCISELFGFPIPRFCFLSLLMIWLHSKTVRAWILLRTQFSLHLTGHQ